MNKIKKVVVYSFCTLLSLVFVSCSTKPDIKKELVTIEMQKITGEWITSTYSLPIGTTFNIDTNRGSYSLDYCSEYCHTLRNGIIDYKVVNKR